MPTIPSPTPNVQSSTDRQSAGAAAVPVSDGARIALMVASRELRFIAVIVRNSETSDLARERVAAAVEFVASVLDTELRAVELVRFRAMA